MNPIKIIEKKSLNPQYITDEAGHKTAIILSLSKFDELMNHQMTLAKLAADSRDTAESAQEASGKTTAPTSAEMALATQKISLSTQHYDLLTKLLSNLQQYQELKSELDRKIHFQKLLATLDTEVQELRAQLADLKKKTKPAEMYNVPELPKNMVINPKFFSEIKGQLLLEVTEGHKPSLLINAPSGMGKTLLATALARDEEVRQVFPDGIFWIGLGKEPPVLDDQIALVQNLEGSTMSFVDVEMANEYLRQLCTTRACLVILDDVWDVQEVLAFNLASEHSQLLITTSDSNLLNITQYFMKNIQGYALKTFPEKQAIDFFLRCVDRKEITANTAPIKLDDLVTLCNCLPSALKLIASLVRNQSPTTWPALLNRLQNEEYEFPAQYPRALMQALHFNVETLGEQADYYLALAVFSDYSRIPQVTVVMLWRYLYQLLDDQANNFIKELADKGLLDVKGKLHQRYISLHSFQHDYLVAEADLEKLHNHLLAAYRRQCGQHGWLSGPNDGYFFEYLGMHLVKAGRKSELKMLLLDFDWMQKKLQVGTVHGLVHDYELVEDRDVEVVKNTLYESAPILIQNKSELAVQLLDRLWGEKTLQTNKDIQALLNQAKETCPNWVWQPHFEKEAKKA